MNIQSGYYEAGIVLFWLLFAYLFMDKFLFRGGLGEICFGKMRRRMAKGLRSIAGWFDPTKEEPKKGRRRTKGKTEKKEVPAVAVPEAEERNHPTVKVEMKDKEKDEVKEKGKGKNKPIPIYQGMEDVVETVQAFVCDLDCSAGYLVPLFQIVDDVAYHRFFTLVARIHLHPDRDLV